jgi:16S rRNA processing protein RimM
LWKRNNEATPQNKVSERLVPLGEIVAIHGLKGWLNLKPYNPETTVLSSIQQIFLEKGGACFSCSVQMSRSRGRNFLIKLREIDEAGEAGKWVGSILSIDEEALQPLKPGEYYYYQVVGLDVFDLQGQWIGKVTRIWSKEGGDLYVVRGTDKEHLIPAVKEVIEKIDFAEGKMIINPPAGLLDL